VEPVTCSEGCLSSLSYLAEAVTVDKEAWPLSLLDAAGKPGPGIRFKIYNTVWKIKSFLSSLIFPQKFEEIFATVIPLLIVSIKSLRHCPFT
jgi:hypothetical protein